MSLLDTGAVVVADQPPPLFRYALPDALEIARKIEPLLVTGGTDAELWAALISDETRLASFRVVHGNTAKRRPKGRE